MNCADLETAVAAARPATLQFHALLAIHGIEFKELYLLLVWPAGLSEAHEAWLARMVNVMQSLARDEGIPDATKLSGRDLVALTHRAYDLVMS